jgi:general secretion pathway protein E|tara:strand:- start:1648 stop:3129 length:1482 start_codon:yes stop_codon:yes gene_type:complete
MSSNVKKTNDSLELPYRFAKEKGVIFDRIENRIVFIKSNNQSSLSTFSELRNFYQLPVSVISVRNDLFEKELAKHYSENATSSADLIDVMDDTYDLSALVANIPKTADLLDSENDAPVIKLINAFIAEAIKARASDIHIEPYEEHLSVRFRVDGMLKEVLKPNSKLTSMLNARIKIMSNLDIAEKRVPQDGRMSLSLGEKWIDIRVSTLPCSYGERIVLRILDKADSLLTLEQIGMKDELLQEFKDSLKNLNGIILVTGPTGSGKTTSLYAGLNLLNDSSRNIITVEDPVEYAIDGVSQTQVNTKVGMTFGKGLRAILRQDPDIIMVGEIRDFETAEIAIQASLTGHLVLSSVHTNNASSAITRMKDMGIESYLLASTVKGILAQRLVRKLCVACKEEYKSITDVHGIPLDSKLFRPKGCSVCNETGYTGRIGVFEFLSINDKLKEAINNDSSEESISNIAFKNQNNLVQSGVELVTKGLTSVDELMRVTKEQ